MMDSKTYLYNTLTKQVDEFVPNEPGKVAMYTCGPTVYHYAHIGNLRSYIMEDILEKYLRFVGYDVKRVMNITDDNDIYRNNKLDCYIVYNNEIGIH